MNDLKVRATELIHAMSAGDYDALRALVAPDITYTVPQSAIEAGFPVPIRSVEEMIDGIAGSFARHYAELRPTVEVMISEGNRVAALIRQRGLTRSGADYENLYAFFARFENGLVVELVEATDTAYAMRVLMA